MARRYSTLGDVIDQLKENLNAKEILNEDEIICELTTYSLRFNDSEPVKV